MLEKTLESPLDCGEIQQVHSKGNQSWIFIGRIDVEAETPILWPPDGKNWLIWKDPDAGKDWRQEEKGMAEDEMVGWHHQLDGHEFEQALGVGDGQGGLVCCSPWGRKESDMTEWLNWTDFNRNLQFWLMEIPMPAWGFGAEMAKQSHWEPWMKQGLCSRRLWEEKMGHFFQQCIVRDSPTVVTWGRVVCFSSLLSVLREHLSLFIDLKLLSCPCTSLL